MTATQPRPRKRDLAAALARTEPSVYFGEQSERYWMNAHMRRPLADLERMYEKRLNSITGPDLGGCWTGWQRASVKAF